MKKVLILLLFISLPALAESIPGIDMFGEVSAPITGEWKSSLPIGSYYFACMTHDIDTRALVEVDATDDSSGSNYTTILEFRPSGVGPSGDHVISELNYVYYRMRVSSILGPDTHINCSKIQ